ncbi:hypothetical protein DdX_18334 [Ditylenchus destructor]|uniref:Uncharacterized protein n=1 Tax=Ditylenchus destructor TaxID=166010 RepID=A0AAD4MQ93_9BILA|nr:hypothetical protein DdX_18334 [Ditylenchus destructor]
MNHVYHRRITPQHDQDKYGGHGPYWRQKANDLYRRFGVYIVDEGRRPVDPLVDMPQAPDHSIVFDDDDERLFAQLNEQIEL